MNRRSFLATVLGAAASIPLLSKATPQPKPEPKADTLGQDEIAPLATIGYDYTYAYYREPYSIYYREPFLLRELEPHRLIAPIIVNGRAFTMGSLDRIYA